MKKEFMIKLILTAAAIFLMILIASISLSKQSVKNNNEEEQTKETQEEPIRDVKEEEEEQAFTVFADKTDFLEKEPETLYAEAFQSEKSQGESAVYYIEDGTLYSDQYVETGKQDEEGNALYEWKRKQKIAEKVKYVDYNSYAGTADAVYITEDHILHGTGRYETVNLTGVTFARAYADQMIALKTDGTVWCRGWSPSLSDEQSLTYQDWQMVLEDVAYATLGHYLYMAVKTDGSLYMWGDNTLGQFGDGSLLEKESGFSPDVYFYGEPVKVADHVKMIWHGEPGKQYSAETQEPLRSFLLTDKDELFVCGEEVNGEERSFGFFGEMGFTDEGYTVNCTSRLIPVEIKQK